MAVEPGEGIYYTFGLLSDGRVVYFSAATPLSLDDHAVGTDGEPCFRTLHQDGRGAGVSFTDHYTLYDHVQSLPSDPYTGLSPGETPIRDIAMWGTVAAVDEEGSAWLMPEDGNRFERLDLPTRATALNGRFGICILLESGDAYCYSPAVDEKGRFGLGAGVHLLEFKALGLDPPAVSLGAGLSNVCYAATTGDVLCAGSALAGMLGLPPSDFPFPENYRDYFDVVPGLPPIKRVFIGDYSACALDLEDGLWCWGSDFTKPPVEDPPNLVPPKLIGTFPGMTDMSISSHTSCILHADGTLGCIGYVGDPLNCGDPEIRDGWTIIDLAGCPGER